jgi:SAM-dependent methyltransferase
MTTEQEHWDGVYRSRSPTGVSWYEASPARSLELIHATGVQAGDGLIDVGGGMSFLVDELLREGFTDVSVLDISGQALQRLRERLGAQAASVRFLEQDVTAFEPERRYSLWHDRAVFHFLVEPTGRLRYVEALRRAVLPGGHVIIATFGPDGPQQCSNLPVARYDAAALAERLGSEFKLMDSSLTAHRTPRGSEQQFLYCRFRRAR